MIKGTAQLADGRMLLILGLSQDNLDEFSRKPLDTYIKIDGKELGLGIDVTIFSGKTNAEIMHAMQRWMGANTKVHVDKRSKN